MPTVYRIVEKPQACSMVLDLSLILVDLLSEFPPPGQDEVYEFPSLEICVWGGKGCDERLNSSTCIGTAGFSVYDPCSEETEDLEITSQVSVHIKSLYRSNHTRDAIDV